MPTPHHIAAALCAAGLMSASGFAFAAGDVVISQIYGGNASVQLQATGAIAAGTYPVGVQFTNNEAQSASCTVDVTVAAGLATTPVGAIQGTGGVSPLKFCNF